MTRRVTVLVFCGLPGSGKSTLARQYYEHGGGENGRVVLVEYDALARQLQVQDDSSDSLRAWRKSRLVALNRLDKELSRCLSYCSSASGEDNEQHCVILLDDNFHLRSMRKDVHRICQKHTGAMESMDGRLFFGIVWVDTPVRVCLERNHQRQLASDDGGRVPDAVIRTMLMEAPNVRKAPWEANILHLTTSTSTTTTDETVLDALVSFVETRSLQHPVLPPPPDVSALQHKEREATLASVLHQCDGWMRLWVTCVAQISRAHVRDANTVRKRLLLEWRVRDSEELPRSMRFHLLLDEFLEQLQRSASVADWTNDKLEQLRTAMQDLEP